MSRSFDVFGNETNRSQFIEGFRDTLPVMLGIVPFAIIVGFTGVELGFTFLEITAMSAIVFAGASQLVAIFLMADHAHIAIVVMAVILVNMRFVMYSASLAPIFKPFSKLRKAIYGFIITDPGYALTISRSRSSSQEPVHWYYAGTGTAMWIFWLLGTIVGAAMQFDIPDVFPVELVLPLVFIALLVSVIDDRATRVTALVSGTVAVLAAPLAYDLGLLIGVGCGILVGVLLNR